MIAFCHQPADVVLVPFNKALLLDDCDCQFIFVHLSIFDLQVDFGNGLLFEMFDLLTDKAYLLNHL